MNESDALALVLAVEAQDGRVARDWQVSAVDDLGWVAGAVGVRSNQGYAIAPSGRIGSFPLSTNSRDALTRLAALPEPSEVPLTTGHEAQQLLESTLARMGTVSPTALAERNVCDLGWLFALQGAGAGAGAEVCFVVTRTRQVALCPASDPTGEPTMREVTAAARDRIPVANLVAGSYTQLHHPTESPS